MSAASTTRIAVAPSAFALLDFVSVVVPPLPSCVGGDAKGATDFGPWDGWFTVPAAVDQLTGFGAGDADHLVPIAQGFPQIVGNVGGVGITLSLLGTDASELGCFLGSLLEVRQGHAPKLEEQYRSSLHVCIDPKKYFMLSCLQEEATVNTRLEDTSNVNQPDIAGRIRAALVLSLLVSVACNILAAEPTAVGRAVAAWPPISLMLVVDVIGRGPQPTGWLGRMTTAATAVVALVAAVASFSHMRAVALAAGESDLVAWMFPLTVDGLAVVCSIGLVEARRRQPSTLRNEERAPQPALVGHTQAAEDTSAPGRQVRPLLMLTK